MVQPKYRPEEALQRIKLMMGYDSSKTLNENKEIIFEQSSFGDASKIAKKLVNALVGDVQTSDLSDVETILTDEVFGKSLQDGTCLLKKVNEYFNTAKGNPLTTLGLFVPGDWGKHGNIQDKIKNSKEEGEPEFEDVKKELLKLIDNEEKGFCKTKTTNTTDTSNPEVETRQEKPQQVRRTYVACPGTTESPFKKLCYEKDPNGPLHKVQACLGVTPDGKFWNKTEQALVSKTGKNSFTINDVNTICGKQNTPTPSIEDEFEVDVVDAEDIFNQ
jgi:hypothetical protein